VSTEKTLEPTHCQGVSKASVGMIPTPGRHLRRLHAETASAVPPPRELLVQCMARPPQRMPARRCHSAVRHVALPGTTTPLQPRTMTLAAPASAALVHGTFGDGTPMVTSMSTHAPPPRVARRVEVKASPRPHTPRDVRTGFYRYPHQPSIPSAAVMQNPLRYNMQPASTPNLVAVHAWPVKTVQCLPGNSQPSLARRLFETNVIS